MSSLNATQDAFDDIFANNVARYFFDLDSATANPEMITKEGIIDITPSVKLKVCCLMSEKLLYSKYL